MRSSDIFRALDHVSNRFALCQVVAQSARRLHKTGNSMEVSIHDALGGVREGKFRGEMIPPVVSVAIGNDAPLIIGLPELL